MNIVSAPGSSVGGAESIGITDWNMPSLHEPNLNHSSISSKHLDQDLRSSGRIDMITLLDHNWAFCEEAHRVVTLYAPKSRFRTVKSCHRFESERPHKVQNETYR